MHVSNSALRSFVQVSVQRLVVSVGPRLTQTTALAGLMAFTAASSPHADPGRQDDRDRAATVQQISTMLTERYVFPEAAKECAEKLRERLAKGSFDAAETPEDMAAQLTELLRETTGDLHLLVRVRAAAAGAGPDAEPHAEPHAGPDAGPDAEPFRLREAAQRRDRARAKNFGFETVQRLEGNVGLIDLRSFASPRDGQAAAVAAMALLENTDALIFDLRKNGGGSPGMVQFLSSHLFDRPTHLNSLYWREGDRTQEFWTLPGVPGIQRPRVPVFVLMSSKTFSAAEEFSYNLQALGRATLIGETTRGGAHPGGLFPVNDELEMVIPTGRAINPITGTNWEGVGVSPDVETAAADALSAALKLAQPAAEKFRAAQEALWSAFEDAYRDALELTRAGQAEGATAKINAGLSAALAAGIIGEPDINALGYEFLSSGHLGLSVATLGLNVISFPDSANAYDSLGEALRASGDLQGAITNYERALELEPDGPNSKAARSALEELRREANGKR